MTIEIFVPACHPAGAVASPVWAVSNLSSTYVNNGIANNTEPETDFSEAAAEENDVEGNVEVMTKAEVLVPACPPAGAVASPIWATLKFADKLTTKVLVPACLPAGAVASPVWATSDRSSGCVRDGCFSSGLCPKETRPSGRRFSVGVVFRMLRFFVLVGAGGVAHAAPS